MPWRKGWDHLELRVQQRVLDEQRHLRVLVGEALPVGEEAGQLLRWWWHEVRCLDGRARCSDPVLGGPQLAGRVTAPADPGDEPTVHPSHQPRPQRQAVDLLELPLERIDIGHDLLHVGVRRLARGIDLEDLVIVVRVPLMRVEESCFAQEVGPHEHTGSRQEPADPGEASASARSRVVDAGSSTARGMGREVGDVPVGTDRATRFAERSRRRGSKARTLRRSLTRSAA